MKRFLLLFTALITAVNFYAQGVDDVTLVVNGSGVTKEEAIHTALRGAIEQAFGVFVSANTSIVNDELVKDEIATVTSGNVKSFTELESVALPNGNFAVTLQTVVSTQKLAAYAKSKGSSCEFAGATFGANLKLIKLNKINTEKAFDNLMLQLETLAPYIFDYNLELGQPTQIKAYRDPWGRLVWSKDYDGPAEKTSGCVPSTIKITSNENTVAFVQLLKKTMQALALNEEQASEVKALGEETFSTYLWEYGGNYNEEKFEATEFKFYSDFPVKRLNKIIEYARASYVITSDMAHKFILEEEKTKCKKVEVNLDYVHLAGGIEVFGCYGARLYAGDGKYGGQAIIIPEWKKNEVEVSSESHKKSKKQISEETPEEPKHQPIELNTIDTDLLIPVEDLMKISKIEVVKVNWIEFLEVQVEKEPTNEVYYKKLISYYADNNKYDELMVLITKDVERDPEQQLYYKYLDRYFNETELDKFLKWCVEKDPENQFYSQKLTSKPTEVKASVATWF